MFEPIHGSAFDITGKGIANPVGDVLDGRDDAGTSRREARRALLMRAVEQVCAAGILTPDLGGTATTKEVTRAVFDAMRGANWPDVPNASSAT